MIKFPSLNLSMRKRQIRSGTKLIKQKMSPSLGTKVHSKNIIKRISGETSDEASASTVNFVELGKGAYESWKTKQSNPDVVKPVVEATFAKESKGRVRKQNNPQDEEDSSPETKATRSKRSKQSGQRK